MDEPQDRDKLAGTQVPAAVGDSKRMPGNSLSEALQLLLRGGAAFVGHDFFPAVVVDLVQVLQADIVFVGRLTDNDRSVETVAVSADGQIQKNFSYSLKHTPCAAVICGGMCIHPRDVAFEFPEDDLLLEMGIEGYIGVPLHDVRGESMGLIVALYRGPIPAPDLASSIMLIFAARTAAEMERVIQDEAQRELEARLLQAQKLESLGLLAGGIAHDFNNLLMAISGSADLGALELPESHPAMHHLRFIGKTTQRAGELCRQLLAYAGKATFELRNIDIACVISDAEELLRTSVSKNVLLELRVASGLPAAEVDLTQLRQILLNLVVNASEAIGESDGTIVITTGQVVVDAEYLAAHTPQYSPKPGEYVFIEVTDTGAGMSAEVLSNIFDPFFTTKFAGRGLGLAAILGIVRGHRGGIELTSEAGQGTSFKILFPTNKNPPDPVVQQVSGLWTGTGLALVIDDDPGVLHVGSRLLQALDFETLTARDGAEGLAVFRKHADRVRVVLLDLTMPNMSGEMVHRELRRLRPDLPILLMSGFTQGDATIQIEEASPTGFLQKPFRLEDIRRKVRAVVGEDADTV